MLLCKTITLVSDEPVFAKSSWSSSSNTELMEILRVSGIDTVLVCGKLIELDMYLISINIVV